MRSTLRIESLEARNMLTAPPTVTDVNLSSTAWDADFIDKLEGTYLGTDGYSVTGSPIAPWDNIDTIIITLDQGTTIKASDLSLSGKNTAAFAFSDFSYDSINFVATWTLAAPLAKDKYFIDLNSDGLAPVENIYGQDLDGDGYGGYGGDGNDYELRFDVLPGDANQDGTVSQLDWDAVDALDGKTTVDVEYDPFMDLDGYGGIDSGDTDIVDAHYGGALPGGDPEGVSNDAPSTSGLANVSVNEDAADSSIGLYTPFEDYETADNSLIFSVVSNSNPGLFTDVTIDGSGNLILDYAADANGAADIVVRATDTGGLFVETTQHVTVTAVNDAPVISNFQAVPAGGDFWLVTGTVTDVDDDPEGWTVTFGGKISGTTTVAADGTFSFIVLILPVNYGKISAQTEDDDEAESNLAEYIVV